MNRPAWEMMPGGALRWTGDEYIAEARQEDGEWRWSVWHVWSDRVPDPDPASSGVRASCAEAQRAALDRVTDMCIWTLGELGWDGAVERDGEFGPRRLVATKAGEVDT
jgi:hypothetical protein